MKLIIQQLTNINLSSSEDAYYLLKSNLPAIIMLRAILEATLLETKALRLSFMAVIVLLSSCAEIRLLTYPADFTWIGKEHLKTTMHEMGNSVSNINDLLEQDTNTSFQQSLIVDELDLIESYAISLTGETQWSISDQDKPKTNHPQINDSLDEFIESIEKARWQAQATPPNYYGVGRITGGCSTCHRIR